MSAIGEIHSGNAAAPSADTNGLGVLSSEDFLKLLITQISTQDPLEPVGNQELLDQISSIRDIELSTSLTDSIQSLTGQQNFAAGSALIGQFVTANPDESGNAASGVVEGVRFEGDGQAVLQLSGGGELPLANVQKIEPPVRAAESLVGSTIVGMVTAEGRAPELVEGLVRAVRKEDGRVLLELDSGEALDFQNVLSVAPSKE